MGERSVYLAFSTFPGIGPVKFEKLIREFGLAKDAWNAPSSSLRMILGSKLTDKFETFRKEFDIEKYEEELVKKKVSFVCLSEKEYPPLLKKIPNPPILLYVKGDPKILHSFPPEAGRQNDKLIAIVGTRRITAYGRAVTDLFSSSLASSGLTIVSGLALGVDGRAHVACLESKGKTIAVLGNGVDICFPRENQKIYDRILAENGAIISEYPIGQEPSVGSFPARNRIVAGLSDGILVTEGASDSGSLITARFGLEFGRKVFAVPGPITSSLSAAPLRLIEKGAKLVVSPQDILKELDVSGLKFKHKQIKGDTKEEQKIIDLLENESLQFDEIVRRLKLDPSTAGTILSMMELKGIINSSNGAYEILTS